MTHSANTTPCQQREAVRSFYERFPYPTSRTPMLRLGFDARVVCSRGHLGRPVGLRRQILDAGCGRGVGLVTAGTLHPEASVLGVDLCHASLADARSEIERRKLTNTRVEEVDLMTLEGLDVPDGGFHVIYSSGVLHHLSDPLAGLRNLADVLAPSGVLVLMVYGAIGRRHVKRVSSALAAWIEPGLELSMQLGQARLFVEALAEDSNPDCPWSEAAKMPDTEFADRYLHPLETDYDVPGLFDLVESAGLRFLRWCCPEQWSLDDHLAEGPMRDSIEALPERERFTVIEQIVRPRNMQAYLCQQGNGPRQLPPAEEWDSLSFAVNAEVHFDVGTRSLWCSTRMESVTYVIRGIPAQNLETPILAGAGLILSGQNEPFLGSTLIGALVEDGFSPAEGRQALGELLRRELIYVPHPADLQ